MSKTFAPFGEEMTECSIDLRVGGNYHYVFVTDDGTECSFRGTYLEIEPPTRTVETWLFEGWPHLEAVETGTARGRRSDDADVTLTFRDKAGRDHMTKFNMVLEADLPATEAAPASDFSIDG